MGFRAKSTYVLGLVGMISLMACGGAENAPTPPARESVRVDLKAHKVQLSAEQAQQLEQRGANMQVLGDYGSFKVVQVDDKALASLPAGARTRDDFNQILLNAGVIDTASDHGQSLRGMKLQASGKRFHIVQFTGPIKPEWVKGLQATGVKLVTYLPNNAYLVYGDVAALSSLQKHVTATAAIQWDGAYLDDYKLNPAISTVKTPTYSIQLIKDEEANGPTLELIRAKQSRNGLIREKNGYVNVMAYLTVKDLYEIATRPDVLSIMPRPTPKKLDERQDMILAGQLNGNDPKGPGYLAWLAAKGFTQAQFTASGFGVDVSDSGMDNGTQAPNHFGLYMGGNVAGTSRVVYNRLEGFANSGSTIQGCDGHGNLNTHIVAGYTNLTAEPFTDTAGFTHGLGVAPFVKVGSSVVFDPSSFTSPDYYDLQSRAYRDGMRISTNSWGANFNGYDSDAQDYDSLVRDAQQDGAAEPAAGNQEMVIVFAAGNGGPGANSVGTPGTAKNIITVGASENVHPFGAADLCGVEDSDADSLNDMAFFSSRGPTADGRKKPDIVAPGTHISGGVAQVDGQRDPNPGNPNGQALSCFDAGGVCGGPGINFFPAGQQWYTASSGTSHSTPAVAGGTALVRQYFINQNMAPPSAAMTKAYLMNSARYMTGSGANDNLFSNNQGMGLMDLGMAFDGTPRLLDDQTPESLLTATGETRTFEGTISDSSKPFRVTLAWTDAPGSTTGSAWKNNLDLSVTVGGNTYKGNVFTGGNSVTGGMEDSSNNVESVFLPAGTEGDYTVTVTAANINSDGVPGNSSALDQDFALIAYNSCTTAAPTPTGVSAVVNGNNQIDVSWTTNGALSYSIYRSTTAGGPYTRVAKVTAPPYQDKGVSGGTTYYYVVRAAQCAESPKSEEISVTATGQCTLPPTFAGVAAVDNGAGSTCATNVSWLAAKPICGGSLTYSVYRSTSSGFTPSAANRIATGLTSTSFADDLNLSNGTPYYYVVRATETSNAVNEDSNTTQKSAVPTGVITPGVNYFDDLDGNRPADSDAYWTTASAVVNLVSDCHYQSATNAFRIGAANTSCGGTYPISTQATLALGGDGTITGVNGFAIPATTRDPQLSFNLWYDLENQYDGAWLVYSTTSASGPWISVNDAASSTAPYISAGGYDNTLKSDLTQRIWTSQSTGGNGSLKPVTVNLAALAGQTVWFGFKFSSDSTVSKEGIYLDDVRIKADAYGSCSTNTPPPGPAVAYRITGLPSAAQVNKPATFTVTAVDAVGVTATGYTGSASFTSTDAAAVLPPNAAFTAGVASNVSITFNTAGPQSVIATDTANAAITGSASTDVTDAVGLVFTVQPPATALAGASLTPAVKVGLVDASGNPVTKGSYNITLSLAPNANGATAGGTTTVAAVNGVATFSGVFVGKAGTGYKLVASASGLDSATSSAFNITPAAAAKVAFVTQPSTGIAGAPLAPAVQVAIQDAFGNTTNSSANVTVSMNPNADGATLGGTTTVAAVGGVASFTNLLITKAGAGYTLSARSGTFTGNSSSPFDIGAAAAYRVMFTQQPTDVLAGVTFTQPVRATIFDRYGNLAGQATNPVTVSLGNNPPGAKLRGLTTVNPVNGVATFSNLSVTKSGLNYTLVAGSSGLFSDNSVGFNVTANPHGGKDMLVFRKDPTEFAASDALSSIEVELQDADGNVLTDNNDPVTLSLGENPTGGQLNGTTTVSAINGVATFTGLTLRKAGNGYSLVAAAQGFENGTSAAFKVTPGPLASFSVSLPASVTAGEEAALTVTALDAYGNMATSYSGKVQVSSSDTTATFASTATFVEGVLSNFKVTFKGYGLRTLTFADASDSSLSSFSQTNVTAFAQPTVSVIDPAGGTVVSGTVNITAKGAVAPGTTLTKLSILVDGSEIASGTDATVNGSWDSSKAQAGSHIITAVVTDGAGNVVSSSPVIVSIAPAEDSGCSCGATSGTDAGIYLGLLLLAHYAQGRRRSAKQAA
ncbi:MAG: S8 family serine peptidase [Hyalangium sp.]|uniref:S8 family serine peptidase n=1 Tax=Hyalangium sp. TaxID=2028555 RepID=UPI00389ABD27